MVYHQVVFCFYNAFNADNTELHVISRSSLFFDIKRYQKWYLKASPMQLKVFGKFSLVFVIHFLISFRENLPDGVHLLYMEFTLHDLYCFFSFLIFFCKSGILYMGNFICFTARARRFSQVFCDLCGKQFNKIINKNTCVVYICLILFPTHLTWSWRSISWRFRWSLLAWSHTFAWIR